LVVDDEPDITFTLQAGLEDGGFDVDAFIDPELVLSSFKPGLYDLVLMRSYFSILFYYQSFTTIQNITSKINTYGLRKL
jgi:DNA-binding response OmpR family regulator